MRGIYVAPLQVKANKNVTTTNDMDIFAFRWEGGMVIVTADILENALTLAVEATGLLANDFQINKLPNATSKGEPRVLYMEIRDEINE